MNPTLSEAASMVDFSQYQPPGISVEDFASPVTIPVANVVSIPVLVGPTLGHRSLTEQVTLDGTAASALSRTGVDQTSITVTADDGTEYVKDTDYTVATVAGTDQYDDTTTIARIGAGSIGDGDTVFVSYQYTDTAFTQAQRFNDYESVKALYGDPINLATGEITSPLTLAARIAFLNGAPEIICVPTLSADTSTVQTSELTAAYNKVLGLPEAGLVVPLPVGITGSDGSPGNTSTVVQDLLAHCNSALNNNGLRRVGIIGFDTGVTVAPTTLAAAADSERIMVAYPHRALYFNGQTNTTIEVGGMYLAAAYAAQAASRQPQHPITKKQLRGFAGLPQDVRTSLTKTRMNEYASGGVAITELTRDGRVVVRHGVTSATTGSSVEKELSLVRAKDTMVMSLEESVSRSGLIGSPITGADTVLRVKAGIAGSLEQLVELGVINAYTGLRARQTSGDPQVIEVEFAYKPSYPLNYIVITFTVDVQTGDIDATQSLTV